MNFSAKALDLIRKWEGLRLEAYICPGGVPSIGYGTTVYPSGATVCLGDRISDQQANAMLVRECSVLCPKITQLLSVSLQQNQFDALVSFVYNLGLGALADSTLLRKLNASDFAGAAAEFNRWNKAIVNGRKVVLEGLTNRRRDERELFESPVAGGTPMHVDISPSPQQQVTWLEGFQDGGQTVIVGWREDQPIEIVTLAGREKKLLVAVINQYPNANTFVIAPPGKPIPEGERTTISGTLPIPPPASVPPPFSGRLLVRGVEGGDVLELQRRLRDLGYYRGDLHGEFDVQTDAAARAFQADCFGPAEADGKVGPRTWARLWSGQESAPSPPEQEEAEVVPPTGPAPAPVPGRTYLKLIRTNSRDGDGLCVLKLSYVKDGVIRDSLRVCSGAPSVQRFRTGSSSRSGSMEPLPEGRWRIHDIVWCAGKDDYGSAVFQSGIGPVTIPIDYLGPGTTDRRAIEIHIDWNKSGSPGTAGCIGVHTVSDYKRLVGWLRETDPRDLYVDWGLGTCPAP